MQSDEPGYWMWESSGVLRPAVEAYLEGRALSAEDIAALRAYCRQWVMSSAWDRNPYMNEDGQRWLSQVRASVDGLTSREALRAWLQLVADGGMDPL